MTEQDAQTGREVEMSRDRANAFNAFLGYLAANRAYFSGRVMLESLMSMLGESLTIHPADRFVFEYARKQGYHIPSYPYDPTSELRAFLDEYGVEDVRAWYERIGIPAHSYELLGQRRLLVVRDDRYRRKAFEMSIEGRTTDDEYCRLVQRAIEFLEEPEHNDPTVF
ncbi:MAG: hypothetical protein ACOX1O_06465 [Eggerthellaceae bacterium]|jgi:hypothetical protein